METKKEIKIALYEAMLSEIFIAERTMRTHTIIDIKRKYRNEFKKRGLKGNIYIY
jgi:hypothetical protein